MALFDLYQLAALYNLRRSDAEFLPNHSHPPSMPSTTSCPLPTKSKGGSSPSLPTPPLLPKTPKRPGTTSVPVSTPNARGSSVMQKQDGNTDRGDKHDREDYDGYIREDLSCRVFVDYEVFMQYVLHVPEDWETKWGPALDAVKADANFKKHHEEYCGLCNRSGVVKERMFYLPLVEMANAVLDVVSRSNFDDISPDKRQYYHVNEPNHVKGGVMNKRGLSPDLVVLDEGRSRPEEKESLHWANPLHVLEVKPHGNAICDGKSMPRLIVKGIDPIVNHAPPPERLRYRTRQPDPLATSTPSSLITSKSISVSTAASTSRKRPADGPSAANPRAAKKSKTISVSLQVPNEGASIQAQGEDKEPSPPQPEPQQQVEPALQVFRYLLEMFSVPLLRSHATASLVDRDRLQLYHANRSVILVSSAINFSTDDGKDKLVATIIAFHRLSLAQNGILTSIVPNNVDLLSNADLSEKVRVVQRGNELHFSGNLKRKAFKVTLADVISCDPAMVGRSTLVLNATSSEWGGPLVIKISWPTSSRVSETDFLTEANTMAQGDHEWAAKHLPTLHYAEDVTFDAAPTLGLVAGLFENAKFANGDYVYERRTLRIIIQERLYPFKSLTSVADIGQVFLDVLCVHRWLYDHPGILHRDLSFNNIMCRFGKGAKGKPRKVYGVLTDYDLSSWANSLNPDYTKTSQQRTGTPPFMAQELLRGTSPLHLYRHDVESLFYVMLLVSARHSIGVPEGQKRERVVMRGSTRLPYDRWFNQRDYDTLGSLKYTFLLDMHHIELSPDFEDFRPWLEDIQNCFSDGFALQPKNRAPQGWRKAKPAAVQFDDETLGGCLDYAAVLEAVPHLKGALEGLIIRYPKNPSAPTPSTSDGAA